MKRLQKTYIFGEEVPFPESHASTILRLPSGDMLAAWFGGTKEKANDVMIWISHRENGVWSFPRCVTSEEGIPHWNPVLFQTGPHTVTLYYKIGYCVADWKTMVMTSIDGGVTWSAAHELVPGDTGGRGPVKNKPIFASNGMLLAPASIEQGPWRCFVDISADGVHWVKKDIPVSVPAVNMIQPTLWEHPIGHIHALMRTNCGKIYRSDSTDFGETWCTAYATAMPNNNSGLDCVRMESGLLALVCNPVANHVEKNRGPRTPLSVFLSGDNGETFEKLVDLETEPGEYSYPAIIANGNSLYITYTWNRKRIVYAEIEL